MLHTSLRGIVVAAAAGTLMLTMSPPAGATIYAIGTPPGWGTFNSNTEVLVAGDMVKDGKAVRASLWRKGRRIAKITDGSPNNGPRSIDLSLPEDLRYRLKVCTVVDGEAKRCRRMKVRS